MVDKIGQSLTALAWGKNQEVIATDYVKADMIYHDHDN